MANKETVKIDETPCSVCGANFYSHLLDENGRCTSCVANNLQSKPMQKKELVWDNKIKITEEMIRPIVEKIVKELTAPKKQEEVVPSTKTPIKTKKCAKCGTDFVVGHPAQKYCPGCKEDSK